MAASIAEASGSSPHPGPGQPAEDVLSSLWVRDLRLFLLLDLGAGLGLRLLRKGDLDLEDLGETEDCLDVTLLVEILRKLPCTYRGGGGGGGSGGFFLMCGGGGGGGGGGGSGRFLSESRRPERLICGSKINAFLSSLQCNLVLRK